MNKMTMSKKELDAWNKGKAQEKAYLGVQMSKQLQWDKWELLKSLYEKTANHDEAEWQGYHEALRHIINIFNYQGEAQEGYDGIINNTMNIKDV